MRQQERRTASPCLCRGGGRVGRRGSREDVLARRGNVDGRAALGLAHFAQYSEQSVPVPFSPFSPCPCPPCRRRSSRRSGGTLTRSRFVPLPPSLPEAAMANATVKHSRQNETFPRPVPFICPFPIRPQTLRDHTSRRR